MSNKLVDEAPYHPGYEGAVFGRPMSEVIRERINAGQSRFFANDNISSNIHDDNEVDKLVDEVAEKFEGVLRSLIIDTSNDHNTQDTARRVAKMFIKEIDTQEMEQPRIVPNPKYKQNKKLDDTDTLILQKI